MPIGRDGAFCKRNHFVPNPFGGKHGDLRSEEIGRDVYVGMGVSILYSGDIGDGSVIGAGSTVVKPIPPYSVAVGCPARVIRKRGKAESPEEKE